MTDPKAKAAERVVKHRYVQLVVVVVALLAGLSTIANVWWRNNRNQSDGRPASAGTSSSAPISSSTPTGSGSRSASSTGTPAAQLAGVCLDAGKSPVSCDRAHRYEIFSTGGSCTSDALIAYLGGVPGVDTLATAIRPTSLGVRGENVCGVVTPPGVGATSSARRILDSSEGDAWRRCLDTRFGNREVSCADPHTDEFVFSGCSRRGRNWTAQAEQLCTWVPASPFTHKIWSSRQRTRALPRNALSGSGEAIC